jgi:hypothetical protein
MIAHARLKRLKQTLLMAVAQQSAPRVWPDDEERLANYEAHAGEFGHEPDFPRALAIYRAAIKQAELSTDPPFDPPEYFQPHERQYIRIEHWRAEDRFPAVREAREWLNEMRFRALMGVPPVSEAEFAELAAWFADNEKRLDAIAPPSSLLLIDKGCRICCWEVRYRLRQGPRADGSGRVAEEIRQFRKRYSQERP